MQVRHWAALAIAISASGVAEAQSSIHVPAGIATVEGNSNNTFPWGRNTAAIRIQTVYDSTHFTGQGIGVPIRIYGARWRANASTATWSGTTYNNVEVSCATAAVDQAAVSATFAANRGLDFAQVLNGSVNFIGGTGNGTAVPGPTVVDITFSQPFLYDPTLGSDFLLEIAFAAGSSTGGTTTPCDVTTSGVAPLASRIYNLTDPNQLTGTVGLNHGLVLEVVYLPAAGLYANFSANQTTGASPLNVNFTDTTFTSDPNGVQSWAWDLDGDSVIDSNAQNPSFTYSACGAYDVSLTVTDTMFPASSITKNGFIFADPQFVVNANFVAAPIAGVAPLNVNFTDTSTGSPTSWLWDLDGDNIPDSAAQNPSFTYTTGGQYTVTLTASNACFIDTETKTTYINVAGSGTNRPADKLAYQFNEVRGLTVANVATGTNFPALGTMTVADWQGSPGPGRGRFDANEPAFGMHRGLAGTYTSTNTTFTHTGNMTVMWWQRREASSVGTNPFGYAFGDGTFRSFIAGAAGTGVTFRGSNLGNVDLPGNVIGNYNWQHVALVIDDVNGRWTWYWNGAPASTAAFTPNSFNYSGTGNFSVGANNATSPFDAHWEMDDFRMYNSALSFGDVIASMAGETASTGAYDSGCAGLSGTPVLRASQRPMVPNPTFSVDLSNAEPGRPAVLLIGTQTSLGGVLPIDLSTVIGAGCKLTVLPQISIPFPTGAGNVNLPLPLPADPSITMAGGIHGYLQVIVLGSTGAASNSLDVNLQVQ